MLGKHEQHEQELTVKRQQVQQVVQRSMASANAHSDATGGAYMPSVPAALLRHADITAMQRTVGNQAVQRMFVQGRQQSQLAPRRPPAAASGVVQRFLQPQPALREKKNVLGMRIGTVSKINAMMQDYNVALNAKKYPKAMTLILALSALSTDWVNKYGSEGPQGQAMLKLKEHIRAEKYYLRTLDFTNSLTMGPMHWAAAHSIGKADVHKANPNKGQQQNIEARQEFLEGYGLTAAELAAIKMYTAEAFTGINAGLEAKAGDTGWLLHSFIGKNKAATPANINQSIMEAGRHTKMLNASLQKIVPWHRHPENPQRAPLYRGEAFPQAQADQLVPGATKRFNAFVSTSRLRDVGWGFMRPNPGRPVGVFWIIKGYRNAKRLGAAVTSVVLHEQEVLFPNNTEFTVDKVTTDTKNGNPVKVLEVHESSPAANDESEGETSEESEASSSSSIG